VEMSSMPRPGVAEDRGRATLMDKRNVRWQWTDSGVTLVTDGFFL
jgi:hypothetical protein